MPETRCEILVVGAGVIGLATARALGQAGHDVLVLEQFDREHARGSSHGSSRVFRFAYDDPEWVRLAQEALPLWRALEAETGSELLSLSGSLDTGRDPEPLRRALADCGADFEVLEPDELARRFGLHVRSPALYQPDGGVTWASEVLGALRRGLRILERTAVLSLRQGAGSVEVRTSAGTREARAVVVCAGAWAQPLVATAGIELPVRVTRETIAYFPLEAADTVPPLLDWAGTAEHPNVQVYFLPAAAGLLKAGLHHAGADADPNAEGGPDEGAVASVAGWVAESFGLSRAEPVRAETCLYTSTADERFVLERHGRIVVGSACSGHAFKFAPAVGARLAGLATEALTS